jgi:hypothetical protein
LIFEEGSPFCQLPKMYRPAGLCYPKENRPLYLKQQNRKEP